MSSLLLEAGVPVSVAMQGCGFKLSRVCGCLISHEHKDHSRYVKDYMRGSIRIFTGKGTLDALGLTENAFATAVSADKTFTVQGWSIRPFSVVHDAAEPLGYLIYSSRTKERLLFFTDCSAFSGNFAEVNYVLGECNYCWSEMRDNVMQGRIDASLAKRIVRSHMSLETLIDKVTALDREALRQIWLCHISDSNGNEDEFVRRVAEATGKEVYACQKCLIPKGII